MQIFNHGITAAALFYFVGLLEQRRGLRGIDDFGGLMQRTPLLCGWMSVAMFSSLGLPGLNGFVGEFLIFKALVRDGGGVHSHCRDRPSRHSDRFYASDAISLQWTARRNLQRIS